MHRRPQRPVSLHYRFYHCRSLHSAAAEKHALMAQKAGGPWAMMSQPGFRGRAEVSLTSPSVCGIGGLPAGAALCSMKLVTWKQPSPERLWPRVTRMSAQCPAAQEGAVSCISHPGRWELGLQAHSTGHHRAGGSLPFPSKYLNFCNGARARGATGRGRL